MFLYFRSEDNLCRTNSRLGYARVSLVFCVFFLAKNKKAKNMIIMFPCVLATFCVAHCTNSKLRYDSMVVTVLVFVWFGVILHELETQVWFCCAISTHCNTLQHTLQCSAAHSVCVVWGYIARTSDWGIILLCHFNTLQHSAMHTIMYCNTWCLCGMRPHCTNLRLRYDSITQTPVATSHGLETLKLHCTISRLSYDSIVSLTCCRYTHTSTSICMCKS